MTPLTQQLENKKKDELRERLAELEHKQWSHWTKYMLDELYGLFDLDTLNRNCKPVQSLRRWQKQMKTEYKDLTEKEKDSDREWADKVLEQAIAEIDDLCSKLFEKDLLLQKQRQEILDKIDELEFTNIVRMNSNLGANTTQDRIKEYIKQQLNQQKTEE
jgi:6-phosphogluconolactonase/glucosamine-6-phosphate isomerase/deaminase